MEDGRSLPVAHPVKLFAAPKAENEDRLSDELTGAALAVMRETKGLVLSLTEGGPKGKFDHVASWPRTCEICQ